MNTNVALEKIHKHHAEYITTIKKLYGNNDEVSNYAEDFIQEVYVRLSRYDDLYDKVIKPDGTVSKGYVFFCLRSIVLNHLTRKKVIKYSHRGDLFDMEEEVEATGARAKHLRHRKSIRFLSELIDDRLDRDSVSRHFFEDKFTDIVARHPEIAEYVTSDLSLRDLALERGVSHTYIQSRVLKLKNEVELELGKGYLDRFFRRKNFKAGDSCRLIYKKKRLI